MRGVRGVARYLTAAEKMAMMMTGSGIPRGCSFSSNSSPETNLRRNSGVHDIPVDLVLKSPKENTQELRRSVGKV